MADDPKTSPKFEAQPKLWEHFVRKLPSGAEVVRGFGAIFHADGRLLGFLRGGRLRGKNWRRRKNNIERQGRRRLKF